MNAPSLSGRRVLIVEDEALVAMMLNDVLTSAGCAVIGPAVSTTEALALVERETIHCAVIDVKLTDGMSRPVAAALCARGIPFIVTTGYDEEHLEGFDGAPILQKAYIPDEVITAVAGILSAKSTIEDDGG
jgi:FOG: CheY-like receiver